MDALAVYALHGLEIREESPGRGRRVDGEFRYGETAVIGRALSERISPKAFADSIEGREINLLAAHDFSKPLATTRNGSLELRDTDNGLAFTAQLPTAEPLYMRDTMDAAAAGLIGGISPGFTVPNDGHSFERDGENLLRIINRAILFELSLVTRPAYPNTGIDVRELAKPNPLHTCSPDDALSNPMRELLLWP